MCGTNYDHVLFNLTIDHINPTGSEIHWGYAVQRPCADFNNATTGKNFLQSLRKALKCYY